MRAHLTLLLALLLVCTGAALATTPDGQTPSEETVCDSETGAAYGLCNAYCEAMDCESDNPSASATACDKVRTKFQNITGRDLPCEAVACPCLAETTFVDVLTNAQICQDSGSDGVALIYVSGVVEYAARAFSSPVPTCSRQVRGGEGSSGSLVITPEEATACIQVLRDAAAELGLTCN